MLTRDQVKALTGDADRWLAPLNNALIRWEITSHAQVTMFLAQCAHESGGFKRLVENLHYSAAALLAAWPKRFTGEDAVAMAYDEQRIAERAYGGRMGNGAEGSGDGYRYRGRGIIQLTGRDNYQRAGDAIGLDFVAQPELLEQPDWAASSAGWFWATNGCSALADAGDFLAITKRINGGTNGQADREGWLAKVRAIVPAPAVGTQPAAPIEDRSTIYQPPTPEEKPMGALAILKMFGPVLAELIPQIANIVKPQSESAKRDATLASTIVSTIVGAAEAPNMQAAVEKMQADPAVVETVKKAVVTEPQVMAALQIVEVGGGAAAAVERDQKAAAADKPFWKASAVFWISVLLMPLVYWLVGSLIVGGTAERLVAAAKESAMVPEWVTLLLSLFGSEWQGETRSGGFNLVIGLVLGGICGVYFGVSVTQQKQGQTASTGKEA